MSPRGALAVTVFALLLAAPTARAAEAESQPPAGFGPIEVAASVAFAPVTAVAPTNGGMPIAPMGWGVRAGASGGKVYGGIEVAQYVGYRGGVCPGFGSGGCSPSQSSLSYGLDGGYNLLSGKWVFSRVTLGVGDFVFDTNNSTTHTLYLEPGAYFGAAAGPLFLGVRAGVLFMPVVAAMVPGDSSSSAFLALRAGLEMGLRL